MKIVLLGMPFHQLYVTSHRPHSNMLGLEVERVVGGLCARQKLERDRAVADLNLKIKTYSPELVQSLHTAILDIITDSTRLGHIEMNGRVGRSLLSAITFSLFKLSSKILNITHDWFTLWHTRSD